MSLWLLWWPPTGSSMFMVVVMLLIYAVLHCLYSVGNKITTTTTKTQIGGCYSWLVNSIFIHRSITWDYNTDIYHDNVTKWEHFPRYWPFVWGIHWSPVNSPYTGHWRGALMFSLICVWINGWVNNRETGDLRRHHTHYDVTAMMHSTLWDIYPKQDHHWAEHQLWIHHSNH